VKEGKLHRIADVNDILEVCQGRQNLRATQKESSAPTRKMTATEYISDAEEMNKASQSNFTMKVGLNLNHLKDHLCHQLCLQKTSLEGELKY